MRIEGGVESSVEKHGMYRVQDEFAFFAVSCQGGQDLDGGGVWIVRRTGWPATAGGKVCEGANQRTLPGPVCGLGYVLGYVLAKDPPRSRRGG